MTAAGAAGVVVDTVVISWLFTVVQPDDEMIRVCAELRHSCRQIGHPLNSRIHDGDRWIAAAAIRLGLPLVSHDGVFKAAPRLVLLTAAPDA